MRTGRLRTERGPRSVVVAGNPVQLATDPLLITTNAWRLRVRTPEKDVRLVVLEATKAA